MMHPRMVQLEAEARKWLTHLTSGRVRYEEPMSCHTSFGVGGPAEAYVEAVSADELSDLVKGLADRKIPYQIIGGGTNLIVADSGIPGVVICLQSFMTGITVEDISDSRVSAAVMAGTSLRRFCSYAIRRGLKGMNFALGIPGTVGGAIHMNAGTAMGWMSDVLTSITVLKPSGFMETIDRNELNCSYRSVSLPGRIGETSASGRPIIVSGSFSLVRTRDDDLKQEAREILKNRKRRQPLNQPSAGCIFKNPSTGKSAGELIDLCGLKGFQAGGAQVSLKHANFIVNTGSAIAADILYLMEHIRLKVFERFEVNLEPEVIVIGY